MKLVTPVHYTDTDAEISFFTGRYPWVGRVTPEICPYCGLVRWYGDSWGSRDTPFPIPGTPPTADTDDLPLPGRPDEAE
jgi:hypothetical protein